MNIDDFRAVAEHFRSSLTPLTVSGIVIVSDDGDFRGEGKIHRVGDRLQLEVFLHGERELPPTQRTTYTREQFWKVGGVIEGQVPFWGVSVPESHGLHSARFTVRSGRFSFDRVHHLTASFEDGKLREAVVEAAQGLDDAAAENEPFIRHQAQARLTDYKLVWADRPTRTIVENSFLGKHTHQQRDTLQGEFGSFEYGLIQRGADCEVHVRPKDDASVAPGELARVTQAMYRALAFLHGRHSWPQWERVEDGTGGVAEHATAPRAASANIHTLLTETTAANGAKPTELIGRLLACFLPGDAFSKGMDDYLLLAREAAGADTPPNVRTLGLCAVFEGFTGFLHEHFRVNQDAAQDVEFERARAALVAFATEQARAAGGHANGLGGAAWQRLAGMVGGARALRPADTYQHLVRHVGLPWEEMRPALEAWKKHRHPLAHGAKQRPGLMEQLLATSRIAGAINVLAGAAVGYSGLAVLSRVEERYIRLPERGDFGS